MKDSKKTQLNQRGQISLITTELAIDSMGCTYASVTGFHMEHIVNTAPGSPDVH